MSACGLSQSGRACGAVGIVAKLFRIAVAQHHLSLSHLQWMLPVLPFRGVWSCLGRGMKTRGDKMVPISFLMRTIILYRADSHGLLHMPDPLPPSTKPGLGGGPGNGSGKSGGEKREVGGMTGELRGANARYTGLQRGKHER